MSDEKSKPDADWLIYGANGYTGALIAAEAVRRGLLPRLSGRNREAVAALSASLKTPAAPCDLHDAAALRAAIAGCRVVLHCAGPFSETSAAMVDACLAERVHYLDITGEIEVFSACHERSAEAAERGICLVPGVGFDVVPTDCVAALLKEALPDATSLVLAFEAGGGLSVGTAKTSVAGLGKGGRVRRGGALVEVPPAFKTRTFLRGGKPRSAMTIPWGDVFTAYITTGIPDIEVYMSASPASIASAKRLGWVRPLLRFGAVTRFLQRRIAASLKPPSPETRARTNAYVWGEASAADGRSARIEIETPNGYDLTVTAALGVVERLVSGPAPPRLGYLTPSQLMGARYVLGLPGVVAKAGL
ncbi:MAG TPA: saccharopine dehydrogenase NADP-binding domain-containing protein [Vicinamibacteria bacterium]|nr:saccharopine dehydrogenase NADP-binding domain-containing protein [Vicinamibacteria bacterium]